MNRGFSDFFMHQKSWSAASFLSYPFFLLQGDGQLNDLAVPFDGDFKLIADRTVVKNRCDVGNRFNRCSVYRNEAITWLQPAGCGAGVFNH